VIHIAMEDFHWGTNPVEVAPNSRQLNLHDPPSEQTIHVVFGGEPLMNLILELSLGLTDEQKAHVAERVTVYTEEDVKVRIEAELGERS